MMCPHCGKETDSYISIKADNCINLNLNGGCASGFLGYTYMVANGAHAAAPVPIGEHALNIIGCAHQGMLNTHYHMI